MKSLRCISTPYEKFIRTQVQSKFDQGLNDCELVYILESAGGAAI